MTAKEFKKIREYLTEYKYKGIKWSQEATALELVRTRQSIYLYETESQEIPEIVADRMKMFLRDCAIEQAKEHLKERLLKANTVEEVAEFLSNL